MAEPIAGPSVRRPTMPARLIAGAIRLYQLLFSSWMAPSCRFVPSCSEYAAAAVQTHGAWRGSWLALRRLARCHPLGGSGLDEVPARDCSGHHHQHTTHS